MGQTGGLHFSQSNTMIVVMFGEWEFTVHGDHHLHTVFSGAQIGSFFACGQCFDKATTIEMGVHVNTLVFAAHLARSIVGLARLLPFAARQIVSDHIAETLLDANFKSTFGTLHQRPEAESFGKGNRVFAEDTRMQIKGTGNGHNLICIWPRNFEKSGRI
jgi:hypothetical protein